jgi:hypothetical protein
MATTYIIAIAKAMDEDSVRIVPCVTITCDTNYTLDTDLAEWVIAEVDPKADIVTEFPPIDREKCPVSKTAHDWGGRQTCTECGLDLDDFIAIIRQSR